jgi:hypothetical protein
MWSVSGFVGKPLGQESDCLDVVLKLNGRKFGGNSIRIVCCGSLILGSGIWFCIWAM